MKLTKKIVSLALCLLMLFSCAPNMMITEAASKNTVKTSISKVESKGKGFKVTWKKKSDIKGYQIQYSTSSKFTSSATKSKTVSGAKTTSATISKLKGCSATYYVRVRTYKTSGGKKVYSSWSSAKKVTTLKHKYSSATCTKAKTCKYCGKTSGKKLGHKWKAATTSKPKTCTRCGKTSGKKLSNQSRVYTGGSYSKCYHYDSDCAGKNSHEITWDEVTRRSLKPCSKCVG